MKKNYEQKTNLMQKCMIILMIFLINIIFGNYLYIVNAASIDITGDNTEFYVEPPHGDIVNGEEEPMDSGIHTMDVIAGPYFSSYTPNAKKHINKFKKIGTFKYNNTTKNKVEHSFTIQSSSSTGSDWNGNVKFTSSIKSKIIGKAEASIGMSLKQSRKKNEAVGYTAKMTISPHHTGTLSTYYGGWKTAGKLKTYTIYTANPNKKVYKTVDINATIYPSKSKDIYTVASESKN